MKKVLCTLLVLTLLLSMCIIFPNAAEVDEADISATFNEAEAGNNVDIVTTSASCVKTQAEAVSWLKSQEGAKYNLDGAYGSQCSDFSSAYVNYVLTGNPYGGKIGVYDAYQYSNANLYPNDWQVFQNTASFIPQPGDIFVVTGADSRYGHTGVVVSSTVNNATVADQNGMSDWSLDYGSPAHIHNITWSGSYTPKYFIRPKFKENVPKPTNAWIRQAHTSIPTGTANTFTFGATNASWYNIRIDKDGVLWKFEQGISSGKSYTFADEGNYTVFIAGYNSAGYADSSKLSFTVFKAITLGNSFNAEITNPRSGVNLSTNENGNVFVEKKRISDYQKWSFELQEDNSYQITNIGADKCLDVYYGDTKPKTNIQVYPDNDRTSQRFYLRQCNYGYSIVPFVNTDLAFDIYYDQSGYTGVSDNTNVQDYSYHKGWNQAFTIDPTELNPSVTQEYNRHTYEYYELAVTWEQAVRICENKGGHLVSITNQEENIFVNGMISSDIWLGALGLTKDNVWYWTNCTKATYTNWSSSQPDYYKNIEFYMMMYSSTGKWNDYPNTAALGFVCEYDNGDVNAEIYTPSKTIEKNGITYGIFDYSVDWQTAEAICEAKGGHLVKIDNVDENQLVGEIMSQGSMDEYWIDATDRNSEGIWTDHNGNPLTYLNWSDGEPNNDFNIEQYGFKMKSSDQWADLKGYAPIYRNTGFICEYEPDTTILGDADGDGEVDISDATIIQRYLSNAAVPYPEETLMNADVDGDGVLTILDATFIQRHVAMINTPYPIGEPKS